MRRYGDLIAWAQQRGLFVRVDRATPWGNPFVPRTDGARAAVTARYRDDYIPGQPDLLARLGSCAARHSPAGVLRRRAMGTCSSGRWSGA